MLARELMTEAAYAAAVAELRQDEIRVVAKLDAARDEVTRLGPVAADELAALEQAPEMTRGEFGQAIGRVLREVRVTKAGG